MSDSVVPALHLEKRVASHSGFESVCADTARGLGSHRRPSSPFPFRVFSAVPGLCVIPTRPLAALSGRSAGQPPLRYGFGVA
jgi:hypothetical protein